MVKSVIIIALLVSLFYLVKYIQPVAEPVAPVKVATSRPEKPGPDGAQSEEPGGFNPSVPVPLPDVNQGYVFSEKRKYEKDLPPEAAKAIPVEQGPDPLTSVLYSGSVIAGNIRRALVTYQELAKPTEPRRPSPGRGPAAPAQGATQKKQLNQGDKFLGYVLAAVEPDRLVFEKGDKKVEKFLYDQGKKRLEPPAVASPREAPPTEIGGVPLQAMAPPEVLAAMMAPPTSARRPLPLPGVKVGDPAAGANPVGEKGSETAATSQSNRMVRRSQRLLGIDSMMNVPVTPVPGLPVPNK